MHVPHFLPLLPLNGCWRLAADVVDHPIDAGHFVDDTVGNAGQEVVWQASPVGGHKIPATDNSTTTQLMLQAFCLFPRNDYNIEYHLSYP